MAVQDWDAVVEVSRGSSGQRWQPSPAGPGTWVSVSSGSVYPDEVTPGQTGGAGNRGDRLGYWPARVARAQRDGDAAVLVPPLDSTVQVVDVEDLTTWLVDAAEHGTSGTLDTVGEWVDVAAVPTACATTAPPPSGPAGGGGGPWSTSWPRACAGS